MRELEQDEADLFLVIFCNAFVFQNKICFCVVLFVVCRLSSVRGEACLLGLSSSFIGEGCC